MGLTGNRTFVGFGFGAIQAGLFLYEAFKSGCFRRLVVAEVVPETVAELRAAGGFYSVNIAHSERVDTARIGPVEILNPGNDGDRAALVAAIAEADEMATAVPSVRHYEAAGPGSIHRILADGLRAKTNRAVIYAAENHNRAAEILESLVLAQLDDAGRIRTRTAVRFLNTVIGKMSGFARDPAGAGLATITPSSRRAFLVEAFNRILISRVRFDEPFERGIHAFIEKDDLLPFEEAKLFGHNATHALGAYLARLMGTAVFSDLRGVPGFIPFLRDAFIGESGEALVRRHRGTDPLFTPRGYREYADDLLARMTNPFLMDTVERVGRDPERKLGWDDRLVGTMRMALAEGIQPSRYAIGAAAALAALHHGFIAGGIPVATLGQPLWAPANPNPAEREIVIEFIERARRFLARWQRAGFSDIRKFFAERWEN